MLISILLSLVVWGIILYVLWWALGMIGLPEPFQKIATVILVVISVFVILGILTGSVHTFPFLSGLV